MNYWMSVGFIILMVLHLVHFVLSRIDARLEAKLVASGKWIRLPNKKVIRLQELSQFTALPAVAAVIFGPDRKVLVARRRDDHYYRPGLWQFPGGMIDKNESLIDAARREVKEEVGITGLHYVGICHVDVEIRDSNQWVLPFLVFQTDQRNLPPNPEPEKHDGWKWIFCGDIFDDKYNPQMPGMQKAIRALSGNMVLNQNELIDKDAEGDQIIDSINKQLDEDDRP